MTLYDMYSVNKKYTESDTLYLYNLHIICISMWFFYMIIQKIHIWLWHIWHIWDIYSNIYIYIYIYIYTSFIQASSPTHQANQNPPKRSAGYWAEWASSFPRRLYEVSGWPGAWGWWVAIRWPAGAGWDVQNSLGYGWDGWSLANYAVDSVFFCHDLQGFRSFGHFGRCRISSIHSMVCGSKLLTPPVPCNPTSALERVAS